MSVPYLPGTNLRLDLDGEQNYRHVLEAVFALTGGIYLSQLTEMIGVPAATLQKWVKRGFVSNPLNKRYTRRQTCRMILIALLRHTLSLDEIAELLSWINNNLADEQDDLIDDSELYLYFCDVILGMPPDTCPGQAELENRVSAATRSFETADTDDHERLNQVLLTMILAYRAYQMQLHAREQLSKLRGEMQK